MRTIIVWFGFRKVLWLWGIFTHNWNLYIKTSNEIISKFIRNEFDLWPENEIQMPPIIDQFRVRKNREIKELKTYLNSVCIIMKWIHKKIPRRRRPFCNPVKFQTNFCRCLWEQVTLVFAFRSILKWEETLLIRVVIFYRAFSQWRHVRHIDEPKQWCFHMTSRRPYWCPKTMKRGPRWCSESTLWELNSFLCKRCLLLQ